MFPNFECLMSSGDGVNLNQIDMRRKDQYEYSAKMVFYSIIWGIVILIAAKIVG